MRLKLGSASMFFEMRGGRIDRQTDRRTEIESESLLSLDIVLSYDLK